MILKEALSFFDSAFFIIQGSILLSVINDNRDYSSFNNDKAFKYL